MTKDEIQAKLDEIEYSLEQPLLGWVAEQLEADKKELLYLLEVAEEEGC